MSTRIQVPDAVELELQLGSGNSGVHPASLVHLSGILVKTGASLLEGLGTQLIGKLLQLINVECPEIFRVVHRVQQRCLIRRRFHLPPPAAYSCVHSAPAAVVCAAASGRKCRSQQVLATSRNRTHARRIERVGDLLPGVAA